MLEFVRFLRRNASPTLPSTGPLSGQTDASLARRLEAVEGRIAALETREAQRSLEHVAAVDALDRLARRITARILRADGKEPQGEEGESALSLRNRLRR
jgi:hypothetical protein